MLGFIALAVVAILIFLNWSQRRLFGKGANYPFVLNIGKEFPHKEYVPVKSQDDLDCALKALSKQADTNIYYLSTDGGTPLPNYSPRPDTTCLITNRVIRSDVAEQRLAEASAANDPNVMHRVQSPDPGDIKKVLEAFPTPTPTPTP
jgi:hypothetical protein